MKVTTYEDEKLWLEARLGRITGTRLSGIISKRGTALKKPFWEILAERVAIPASEENAMDRGKRLEEIGIERFTQETGIKVTNNLELWQRDDNPDIAISPDGVINNERAVEVKCLSSAAHCEAYITQQIPSEYEYQVIQYFCVSDELQTLYFVFFDPRMPKDFFYIVVTREEKKEEIAMCLQAQRDALVLLKEYEDKLTF